MGDGVATGGRSTSSSRSVEAVTSTATNGRGHGSKGPNGRSRPRASLACMNCRDRKIKCNKPNPSPQAVCTSCRALRVPCLVSRDGDRRKTGSREQVAMLEDRVQQLEHLVRQQSRAGSQSGLDGISVANGKQTGTGADFNEVSSSFDHSFNNSRLSRSSELSPLTEEPSNMRCRSTGHTSSLNAAVEDDLGMSFKPDPSYVPPPSGETTSAEMGRLTPMSEKHSGSVDADNDFSQPRFYGPTCQLYIQYRDATTSSSNPWLDGENSIDVKIDSARLRTVLFETFWRAQPLSQALIEQKRFQSGRTRALRSQWYSTFLENAMLSCASRMSTSANVRALGPRFAGQAKAEISAELEDPNIATLQGLLLLSDFEATRGKDRLGYMYCGMACRLTFDLGLHENCDDLVSQGKLSTADAHSRYVLFLGTFVYDSLWTLYLGRPNAIPLSFLTAANQRASKQGWSVPPTLEAWVSLSTDILKATQLLNGASPLNDQSIERVAELDSQIHDRVTELPPWLAFRDDDISELDANVYGLHVQFCGIRIVLRRLLTQAARDDTDRPGDAVEKSHTIEQSREIMYDNALRIARLVSAYQQIFGIENVVTVMLDNMYLAAAVLTSHILRKLPQTPLSSLERDAKFLHSLADMLFKAQKHYPVAARIRSTLANLVLGTPLAGLFGSWAQGGSAGAGAINSVDDAPGALPQHGAPGTVRQELSPALASAVASAVAAPGIGGSAPSDYLLSSEGLFTTVSDAQEYQDMDMPNVMSWEMVE